MTTILITGASGGVGTRMRQLLRGHYDHIRLTDIREPNNLQPNESFVAADISNFEQVSRAVEGVDGIVHFGGLPLEFAWDDMLQANIVGTYNILEAARIAGVKRYVFASSNQVVGFYRRDRRLGTDTVLRPSSRYGVTKAFGESLAALYADKHGIRSLCIRIGRVWDKPEDVRRLSIWIAPEDLAQLVRIGLDHPDLHYDIVYGVSDNAASWYDNRRATELGYRPAFRAEDFREDAIAAEALKTPDPVADHFMGAKLAAIDFDGDLERAGR
ncbi:NAD-dependent epimerase/dehydratase family protein [Agrobacterium arsenijevicii]|uniref:UDP-glucose 4-epimerase n=1 Tax=Agrobacterium arsenijevicii TaxID=1585697 RepID=A0ABR5DC03_9HYPH|nr:UDP-glucose 4-epimerase [Agrobacterium arsenijevicii]